MVMPTVIVCESEAYILHPKGNDILNLEEFRLYHRVFIKCPWFGDIRMQLNNGLGARYVTRLIRHVVSTNPLAAVQTIGSAVAMNINDWPCARSNFSMNCGGCMVG